MDLDRGALARIDRKVLSGLDHDEAYRMVRLPISDGVWSTWRNCCAAVGLPMGRTVVALITRELRAVIDETVDTDVSIVTERVAEQLACREAQVANRERKVEVAEERLRRWSEQLRVLEGELQARRQPLETAGLAAQPSPGGQKVGRNEPCPCGSGVKYKRCHGLRGRRPGRA